jgi:hypothetical protein
VINVFLLDYYTRLREWFKLKETLIDQDLSTICIEVDRFWQRAPINTHYLHPDEIENWPNPWELISDNHYCYYGRALGIIYTLMLLGVKELDFVDALDDNRDNVVLVLVEKKYVLNHWPNSVLTNKLSDFAITKRISIESLESKIG